MFLLLLLSTAHAQPPVLDAPTAAATAAEASPPDAAPAAPGLPTPAAVDPTDGLTPQQVSEVLGTGTGRAMERCYTASMHQSLPPGDRLTVAYTIATDGKIASATLSAPGLPAEGSTCMERAMRSLRFSRAALPTSGTRSILTGAMLTSKGELVNGLSPQDVNAGVGTADARSCIEWKDFGGASSAEIAFTLDIAASGHTDAAAVTRSPLPETATACVQAKLSALRFHPAHYPTHTSVRLTLYSGATSFSTPPVVHDAGLTTSSSSAASSPALHSTPGPTRAPGGVISVGDPIVRGGLTRAEVDATLVPAFASLRYCYQRELTARPGLAGRMVEGFTINPDGTVSDATTLSSTLDSTAVEACFSQRIQALTFPASSHPVVVEYPFVFSAP